ncbi:PaaI family thioesterase [Sphingomonas arantia]|uniref:PaaI family thioesterase n=1 Tax=Sphingomonas arantia TaxID=1460676 RepID=A0ABW4TTL9_9SPHN
MTITTAGDGAGEGGGAQVERLVLADDVDSDGFRVFLPIAAGRFLDSFGTIRVRVEGPVVRCRVETGRAQSNVSDNVHGGFILAFVDQVMFCALLAQERLPRGGAVTLQAGMNFIGAAKAGLPIDAVVEITGETGRMLFLRGLIEQDGATIGSFDGTLRKVKWAGAT